jgi:hypothetical protein
MKAKIDSTLHKSHSRSSRLYRCASEFEILPRLFLQKFLHRLVADELGTKVLYAGAFEQRRQLRDLDAGRMLLQQTKYGARHDESTLVQALACLFLL